ncbi:MAG: NTP transferase domain-containing protein, partial [Desulfosporosinus sp.]
MYNNSGLKICATIEARMSSTRLPGKVLLDLVGKPVLQHIIERLSRSKYVDEVIVATTDNPCDDQIVALCHSIGCAYFRGSEDDVLLRVLDTARDVNADIIVEITGDCPVIDWRHVDHLIELFFSGKYDYAANIIERTFPRGFDTQVFPTAVLAEVNELTTNPIDHE